MTNFKQDRRAEEFSASRAAAAATAYEKACREEDAYWAKVRAEALAAGNADPSGVQEPWWMD